MGKIDNKKKESFSSLHFFPFFFGFVKEKQPLFRYIKKKHQLFPSIRASKELGVCTDGNGLVEITVHRLNRDKRGKSSLFFPWFFFVWRGERVGEAGKIIIYSLMWWKSLELRWEGEGVQANGRFRNPNRGEGGKISDKTSLREVHRRRWTIPSMPFPSSSFVLVVPVPIE